MISDSVRAGDPQPNHAGLFSLCGALPDGADDGPCCSLPRGHREPHSHADNALEEWKAAHGYAAPELAAASAAQIIG
jgi:hypothetical protein